VGVGVGAEVDGGDTTGIGRGSESADLGAQAEASEANANFRNTRRGTWLCTAKSYPANCYVKYCASTYSTITLPRSMPIWHWKGISPLCSGVNSMVTVCPSGSLADWLILSKITISLHNADSCRLK